MTSDNLPTFELGEYRIRLLKYRDKYALEHTHRGARKRISLKTDNYQEALDEFYRAKHRIQDIGHDKDIYNSDLLAHIDYYLWHTKPRISDATYIFYSRSLDRFRTFVINERIDDLTPETNEAFVQYLLGRGLAPITLNTNLRVVNQMINLLVKHKKVSPDKYNHLDLIIDKKAERPYIFTDEQVDEILKVLGSKKDKQIYYLVLFALNTGMRRKEIANLTWNDIDFERQIIHIQSHPELKYHPKTYQYRYIKMNETVYDILSRRRKIKDIPYVFYTKSGNNMLEQMRIRLRLALRDLDLPRFRAWHTFRRTFASRAVAQGVAPSVLKEILGHANFETTQRYYVHVMENSVADAVRTVELRGPRIVGEDPPRVITFPKSKKQVE